MKKRHFLLGLGAMAGGLGVAWWLQPPGQRLVPAQPLAAGAGQTAFGGWVKVGIDGGVGIVVPRSEMGQGVHTALAMLLAEELEADWTRVHVEAAPVDRIYANIAAVVDGAPFHPDARGALRDGMERFSGKLAREVGLMVTGGSTSVKDLWLPMRQAGAVARSALVAEAARRWGVPAAECRAERSQVRHAASGRMLRYGDVAAAAGAAPLPPVPSLKPASQWTLIGQPTPRIEARGKTDGSARFGIDARPEGLRHASVVMCPVLGGSVARVEPGAVARMPGVLKVVTLAGGWEVADAAGATGGVAVVADTPWHAIKAARALAEAPGAIVWNEGPAAAIGSAEVARALAEGLARDDGFVFHEVGDAQAALAGAARTVRAEYAAPYLAHFALEPMNCTVRADADGAEVWAPTQVPDIARGVVARTLGLEESRVTLHVTLLGGGFGRRLEVDYVALAAQVARALPGVPVQTLWSREQDTTHDFYRPACVSRFAAGLDAQGRLVAWINHSASQSILPQVALRWGAGARALPAVARGQDALARALWPLAKLPGVAPDKTAAEGSFDQAYAFPAARISHSRVELPIPVGYWRSVGHSHHAFFKESFVDEVAHAMGTDPLALRESLLARHPRSLAVLRAAARMAQWGGPRPPGGPAGVRTALGLALHGSFGTTVAQVAEVSVGEDRAIRVHRVWCALDCGTAVNPQGVAAQIEGSVAFGLAAALHGGVTLERGRVQQSNFHDQPTLRIDASPQVFVQLLPSSDPPEGVGEPGVPPVAPAVANAVFALTGQRLRALPLKLA